MVNTEESACPQCGYSSKSRLPVSPSDSSRIAELRLTSQCPTVEEEQCFRSFVGEGQSFLNDLDTRIALMKASIQALENTRELLQPVVMQYKESLNPIRRMSSDVWGHIFFYGAGYHKDHEDYFASTSHFLDLNSPPWIYGRVCRQWKDIIHSMPSLWARVKIELRQIQTSTSGISMVLLLISIYLRHSKTLPLIVYLNMSSPKSSPAVSDFITNISNAVLTHSWRWKSLVLAGGQGTGATSVSEDDFISLERIEIRESDSRDGTTSTLEIVAPKLRAWSTVASRWSNSVKIMPTSSLFHQITDYSLSAVASSEVLRIIPQFPNLRKLSVRGLLAGTDSPSSERVLCLPNLNEFSIEQYNPLTAFPALTALLDSLSCPALTRLTVIASGIISEAVKRFEMRSNFQLEHLIVGRDAGKFVKGLLNPLVLRSIAIRGDHSFSSVHLVLSEITGTDAQIPPFPDLREL
ncbi:hypothetical protein C8R41DRAFT_926383 [Lentinula lateritia]|uniref:F-box domain-containing protein n=1 Tax=Lentinula lateritia TaxID=40482 RepID=A0ABQ8V2Y7_9AGAR|nr:hypothetical protein C8R41DRAFT_926383 [Lentinula lateritia]